VSFVFKVISHGASLIIVLFLQLSIPKAGISRNEVKVLHKALNGLLPLAPGSGVLWPLDAVNRYFLGRMRYSRGERRMQLLPLI